MWKVENPVPSALPACALTAAVILLGLAVLAVRLRVEQLDNSSERNSEMKQQSERRVLTAGARGRILAAGGEPLAVNRPTMSIVLNPGAFQSAGKSATVSNICEAIEAAERTVGRASKLTARDIERHLERALALPLVVWSDVDEGEFSRFAEHSEQFAGLDCVEGYERSYPGGSLAAQLVGYVGRERVEAQAGDKRFHYRDFEMRGRAGLEYYYDSYLRGVPGEQIVLVDARGFPCARREAIRPQSGPDLELTLELPLQRAVERQLSGLKGACVVLDPQTGGVLAMASAPAFDLNDFVPVLSQEKYDALATDAGKPLLNRACGATYAPGSTFKPVIALAALGAGVDARARYECTGAFTIGDRFRIRCARTWGHGELDLRLALKESCNSYFCWIGCETGTNAIVRAAHAFGLGAKSGIDCPNDLPGVVPDEEWKRAHYAERWYPGDLAQISIGQGMLLVTPLQMARVIGAIGTGRLVKPRLNAETPVQMSRLPFPDAHLDIVREGLRLVVSRTGTGYRGAEGVQAAVMGKTGTAEVGRGASRRKNTWFVAYAKGTDASRAEARDREVAVAMVVECGESGGGTTAPRVCEILKFFFNGPAVAGGAQ